MYKNLLLLFLLFSIKNGFCQEIVAVKDSSSRFARTTAGCEVTYDYDAAGNRIKRTTPAGCVPSTPCVVDMVRLHFRTADFARLNGAKIQGSNNGTVWTDLYTINVSATGSWQTFPINTGGVIYKQLRYIASPNGFGELKELEFYSGSTKMTGETFGSTPNITGMGWENVFDGDLATQWHGEYLGAGAHPGPSNYVGITLDNCGTCATPGAPAISLIKGTTVCPGASVTLKATGSIGTIKWYKGGVLVGTGVEYTTFDAGVYTATTTVGTCASATSSGYTVVAAQTCPTPPICIVDAVRLHFRTSNLSRLNGAKIQGSNNGTTWTDLYTITADGNGAWQTFPINTGGVAYKQLRYVASATGAGELIELEFYSGSNKMTGEPFGSTPNIEGMEWENAFDGNLATQWHGTYLGADAHPGPSNYAGITLDNCGTCATPATPTISLIKGSTVCANTNGSVTLKATGSIGTIKWYKGGVLVGTGLEYTTTSAGVYTATTTVGTCVSAASAGYTVVATPNCPATVNACVVNKVRLHFRYSDVQRLNGAKIQGSNNGTTWTDLYTIGVNGNQYWQEFYISNATPYKTVRYVSSPTGYGELMELEFYNGNTKLTGEYYGSEPNVAGMDWEYAFDGTLNGTWHGEYQGGGAHGGPSNYAGVVLANCSACSTPTAPTVTKIIGTTVCSPTSVTLKATGSAGIIKWYNSANVAVGTGQTLVTTQAGTYYATCTIGSCVSPASATITVTATSGCSTRMAAEEGDEATPNLTLSAAPNPNSGEFDVTFNLTSGKPGELKVFDSLGNTWFEKSVFGNGMHKERVKLKGGASGVFIVQLANGGMVETKKIVVAK